MVRQITQPQADFINILLADCGLIDGKRAWLKAEFGVEFLSELNREQASEAIDRLKEIKEDRMDR